MYFKTVGWFQVNQFSFKVSDGGEMEGKVKRDHLGRDDKNKRFLPVSLKI